MIGPTADGTRLDVEFEGDLDPGGRLSGHLRAVNYLTVRSDGVQRIDVRGTITSPDGDVVSFKAAGLATPAEGGVATVRDAAIYQTASERLAWLNQTMGFVGGHADLSKGELQLSAYTLEE
jgi:hypothetical protein